MKTQLKTQLKLAGSGLMAAILAGCGGGATAPTSSLTSSPGVASAGRSASYTNSVSITKDATYRYVTSNGIADHETGTFPNPNCPSTIAPQDYHFRMPRKPSDAATAISIENNRFGVAINGVPFDAATNEFYNNDHQSGWRVSALNTTGPDLGLDNNQAHVQPSGAYHYHGKPRGLYTRLSASTKMVLVGWAADGYPVYGPMCYSDPYNAKSALKAMTSSYRLKSGTRPSGPGGTYDGTYDQDWEFVKGLGDLGQTNGRFGVTPEFPAGTFYYVLSKNYPVIPRVWRGKPDASFITMGGPPA